MADETKTKNGCSHISKTYSFPGEIVVDVSVLVWISGHDVLPNVIANDRVHVDQYHHGQTWANKINKMSSRCHLVYGSAFEIVVQFNISDLRSNVIMIIYFYFSKINKNIFYFYNLDFLPKMNIY